MKGRKREERKEGKKKGKQRREVRRENRKERKKEGEGPKKKTPTLAPYSHQPTRLLLPSPLPPVSSCDRQNSSLTHLLPSAGPGSGL
jgi:hypothetical protein